MVPCAVLIQPRNLATNGRFLLNPRAAAAFVGVVGTFFHCAERPGWRFDGINACGRFSGSAQKAANCTRTPGAHLAGVPQSHFFRTWESTMRERAGACVCAFPSSHVLFFPNTRNAHTHTPTHTQEMCVRACVRVRARVFGDFESLSMNIQAVRFSASRRKVPLVTGQTTRQIAHASPCMSGRLPGDVVCVFL